MTDARTYQSPIRILEALGLNASEINWEIIREEQLRLLDMLHNSQSETFNVGHLSLSRTQLVDFTKALDSAESVKYHQFIFKQSELLDLLENHAISGNKQADYRLPPDLGEDRQRLGNVISPFLACSIDELLAKTIQKSSYSELDKITPLFQYLSEQDGIFAFRRLKEWGNSLDERLNDPRIIRFEYPAEKYAHFHYAPLYNLINAAASFYPDLPDTVGDALTVFTLSYRRSKNRGDNLLKISNQLQRLKCSPRSKQMILANHTQFRSETNDSGKTNNIGLWITIVSVAVVLSVLLIFVISKSSGDSDDVNDGIQDYRNVQRRAYVSTTPSPSRVLESDFDEDAFKLFHEHTYASVVQNVFRTNDFVWDGIPDIKSPLVVVDSATMQPKGKKVFLENKTDSEMLMVVRDENSLSTHYIGSNSKIRLNLDPGSLIFFYAGNTWAEDESIVYQHPYENIMTDSWTLRYTGRFKTTSKIDQQFLKKMYELENGSVSNLQIREEGGQYVFRGRNYNIPTV